MSGWSSDVVASDLRHFDGDPDPVRLSGRLQEVQSRLHLGALLPVPDRHPGDRHGLSGPAAAASGATAMTARGLSGLGPLARGAIHGSVLLWALLTQIARPACGGRWCEVG